MAHSASQPSQPQGFSASTSATCLHILPPTGSHSSQHPEVVEQHLVPIMTPKGEPLGWRTCIRRKGCLCPSPAPGVEKRMEELPSSSSSFRSLVSKGNAAYAMSDASLPPPPTSGSAGCSEPPPSGDDASKTSGPWRGDPRGLSCWPPAPLSSLGGCQWLNQPRRCHRGGAAGCPELLRCCHLPPRDTDRVPAPPVG